MLDDAACAAPIRKHELDHTDQESRPLVRIGDVSTVVKIFRTWGVLVAKKSVHARSQDSGDNITFHSSRVYPSTRRHYQFGEGLAAIWLAQTAAG